MVQVQSCVLLLKITTLLVSYVDFLTLAAIFAYGRVERVFKIFQRVYAAHVAIVFQEVIRIVD